MPLWSILEAPASTTPTQKQGRQRGAWGAVQPAVAPQRWMQRRFCLLQEQGELKVRASELRAREEQLAAEREAVERERQELQQEKERVKAASLRLQRRAEEVEHMSQVS